MSAMVTNWVNDPASGTSGTLCGRLWLFINCKKSGEWNPHLIFECCSSVMDQSLISERERGGGLQNGGGEGVEFYP